MAARAPAIAAGAINNQIKLVVEKTVVVAVVVATGRVAMATETAARTTTTATKWQG
jgi:hypothetical protein